MNIRFLGTGTSLGVPQPLCSCNVCRSRDRRDNRLRSSVLVTHGASSVLIDAGPDLRTQLLRHRITKITDVLLTHSHYDHVGGIDDLRPYCFAAPDGMLPVHCTGRVADALRERLPYCFREPGTTLSAVPRFDLRQMRHGKPLQLGDMEVLPLPVVHGPDASHTITAFRMGRLGYITDAKTVPYQTIEAMQGVDVLVINALRHTPHPTHMSLRECLEVSARIGAKRTLLTHMSHAIGLHADLEQMLPPGVEPAFDGQIVTV